MTAPSILVVEDVRITARCIETQLTEMGYVVVGSAATGEEAVRRAGELRPDLILMDVCLGAGIDGIEAAAQIRKQMDVPVVFLTADSDAATLQRAKLTGPFGFVPKPHEDAHLRTAIEIGLHHHKLEWQLRENEQWLAAIFRSIGDGVIATDGRGRVRLMNGRAEELTGWTQTGAFGMAVQDVFQIIAEGNHWPVPNPILDALATDEPTPLTPATVLIDRNQGERCIEGSASPIRNGNGKVFGAVLVFRDVTERRRLEDHLRQTQKLADIGRRVGGIAHNFNNLMTVVTGFSELLLSDGVLSAPLAATDRYDALGHIHDAGMRGTALTEQIVAFSREQTPPPRVLNLNTVLRDTGATVKRLIGSNIEFVIEPAPELGLVKADPTQIGQVILNLATNARDAMPRGGRLVAATMNAELDEATTRQHPGVKPGRYAVLSVRDTGFGMSDEVQARVFDSFVTAKGIGEGTGLATVYGVVKQSGGHIDVTSAVGAGTTVRLYLPLVTGQTTPPSVRELTPAGRGHETILLVENEETVRKMTRLILERSGYTVLEASDGWEAVAMAEKHPRPIHLLITDVVTPHLSGREVAERLTTFKQGLRILFVSSYTDEMVVQQGVESASTFLHKPFSLITLTSKVREILDRP